MIIAVTGTDTDVGKTVLTAALAAGAMDAGHSVAIYKPTQTGVEPGQEGDIHAIGNWLGNPPQLTVSEGVRLADPMAPVDAALHAGGAAAAAALPTLADHLRRARALAKWHDVLLIEGAGGLLVSLTLAGDTIADIARGLDARLVVATRPDLGTLNHTALTLEAAAARGFARGFLVPGSFPADPAALQQRNRTNLRELAGRHGWAWVDGPPAGAVADPAQRQRILHAAGRKLAPVLAEAPLQVAPDATDGRPDFVPEPAHAG
ncbi:dethiobiotin synthase [Paeniglutamicibacter psychrophenolicus]|uniref:ATP-dependent dethiobiotin synthetase BioD n=1 Tax=Paeniglutamicibacter psychrophenolicus TaxID=257454 RepID=A0ABS4WB15_9MICC|nr:dethiobiotin synthase [Paeniglutamicibacter psychrophenolicus]MBP2373382.1 dethiobiotin synthase [Paeniglutamicibacter psychrophenolicus]